MNFSFQYPLCIGHKNVLCNAASIFRTHLRIQDLISHPHTAPGSCLSLPPDAESSSRGCGLLTSKFPSPAPTIHLDAVTAMYMETKKSANKSPSPPMLYSFHLCWHYNIKSNRPWITSLLTSKSPHQLHSTIHLDATKTNVKLSCTWSSPYDCLMQRSTLIKPTNSNTSWRRGHFILLLDKSVASVSFICKTCWAALSGNMSWTMIRNHLRRLNHLLLLGIFWTMPEKKMSQ